MVRRWTSFQQDEDFEDDPDAWGLGTFVDEQTGQSMYGYDPETASSLQQSTPPEPVMTPAPPVQSMAPPAVQPPAAPAPEAPIMSTPDDVETQAPARQGWQLQIGSRLGKANNNPGNLRFVGQEGAEEGEGGFARFATPEEGMGALVRQIQLDASRGDTIQSFIRDYAPAGDGDNDPERYASDLAGMLGTTPDAKLSDLDVVEVARGVARIESMTSATYDGTAPEPLGQSRSSTPTAPGGAPAQDPLLAGLGMQGADGLRMSKVQVSGRPLSPEQMAAQTQAYADQRDRRIEADEAARGEYMAGLEQGLNTQATQYQNEAQAAQERMKREAAARQAAADKVKAEFAIPTEQVDPQKYFKELSGGSRIMAAISIVSGAVGQAAFALLGIQTGNTGIQMLLDSVEKNIDAQKQAIRDGKAEKNNRIRHWQEQGRSAAEAEQMARAEMLKASEKAFLIEAQKLEAQGKNNAQAIANAEAARAEYDAKVEALAKQEGDRFVMQAEAASKTDPLIAAAARSKARRQLWEDQRAMNPQPKSAPVGFEDSSPEVRENLLAEFDLMPTGQEDLTRLSKELHPTVVTQQTLDAIADVAKLDRDPVTGRFKGNVRVNTRILGYIDNKLKDSKWIPKERLDAKDQALADHFVSLMMANRAALPTEPNGLVAQERAELQNVPQTEADFTNALNRLVEITRMKEEDAFGSVSPQVRAAWKNNRPGWEVGVPRFQRRKRQVR